jgi:hypothetical protein
MKFQSWASSGMHPEIFWISTLDYHPEVLLGMGIPSRKSVEYPGYSWVKMLGFA